MPIELEKVRSLFDRPEKTGDSQFMRREVAEPNGRAFGRWSESIRLIFWMRDAVIQRIRFFWQSVLTALI